MTDRIKCVMVGDGEVGKTCMLSVLVNNAFPEEYLPPFPDVSTANFLVDNLPANLELWDTKGQEEYDRLIPLNYQQTDIFIVVFSVISHVSFENIAAKWLPEIRHHCPEIPFLLVGNKIDLRETEPAKTDGMKVVSKKKGKKQKRKLGAVAYMECSARKQDGVTEVFEAAVRVVREHPPKEREASSKCCVLC
ncbi:hypothetical protein CAPTEDRAFT_94804 [Capitella teleta]|uniref:Uncharacterized protein n=1 Tax=Capitella teleta TaxID=283909 RepID=R7TMA4_CAPTE|nr:hypothetical protein CAPTEDRAFT_94804 [Capitella teleta]|eukprot:ELT92215.1 hypothetical protein CAPTEDRAFT_94804 [Capitella teleta]